LCRHIGLLLGRRLDSIFLRHWTRKYPDSPSTHRIRCGFFFFSTLEGGFKNIAAEFAGCVWTGPQSCVHDTNVNVIQDTAEERKATGCKGVLFHCIVQLQQEIWILLIQTIVGDQTKLAKRRTIMLREQAPKMVVVAKDDDPDERSLPDEARIAEVVIHPSHCCVRFSFPG